MGKIMGPEFSNIADYDCIVQIVFRDVEDFVAMKTDPEFQRMVEPDHEIFSDTMRTKYVS